MRTMHRNILTGFIISCVLIMFSAVNAHAITYTVSPDHIDVNSFYHGSKVTVEGEVAADNDIIIKISSPPGEIEMRKKGKKGGLLWMNVGEIEFSPVSDIYLLYSTADVESVLSRDQQDRYVLGYSAVRRLVEVSPEDGSDEKEKWVDEFIRFKERNKTYGEFTGVIDTKAVNGMKTFTLDLDWPYQAPPQDYTVSVYTVRQNEVQSYKEVPFEVEQVGALSYISDKAFNSAALYGIVSIFIAIASGFIVSVIFRDSGGGH